MPFYLAWKIYCFRYNSWWIGWNLNIILYLRFNWLSIKLSATNLLKQSHSDVKWRFMYQNWPSKSHQLPFDQRVQIFIPPRSPVIVPEPIWTPSDGILHPFVQSGFVVYYANTNTTSCVVVSFYCSKHTQYWVHAAFSENCWRNLCPPQKWSMTHEEWTHCFFTRLNLKKMSPL